MKYHNLWRLDLCNPLYSEGKQKQSSITITVRQLEAVVRMSEALAKMELQPFASEKDVDEALRLFRVSTI
ncbi:hypothetical protein QR680_015061 [Steinernema hermaphroditum]|uniref:MCM AAA-lid domain-containing protein n=1 Tax=Steinernema hermaphroditum TaxID=289476 RepID=A0AA39IDM6_9BILA|nr:hypothetical protein QR680_015061 [Steinernema hermaphroditum]